MVESQLDIRSFVGVHTNLRLLIRLLFNKQQIILFKHQNDRAITNDTQNLTMNKKFLGRLPKLDLAELLDEETLNDEL